MRQLYTYASYTAFGAGLLMVLMIIVMSMYPQSLTIRLEQTQTVADYSQLLRDANMPLRAVMTIDHIFLVLAVATFLLVGAIVKNDTNKHIIYASIIPIFITGYLDIYENHHIMVMLESVLKGIPISQQEIQQQQVASLMKFHGGNISYFLLAFFFPHKTKLERYFRYVLLFALIPFSVIRYSYSDLIQPNIIAYIPIALGFLVVGYIFYKRSHSL